MQFIVLMMIPNNPPTTQKDTTYAMTLVTLISQDINLLNNVQSSYISLILCAITQKKKKYYFVEI